MADKPDFDEPKIATSFSLTDVARVRLQEVTDFYGLKSRSDLLERLARGTIKDVLWLKGDEGEIAIEAFDFYIQEHRKLITQEEEKGKAGDKELVLLLSIKIAHLRLIRYRLAGDEQSAEVNTLEKAYQKLKREKNRG